MTIPQLIRDKKYDEALTLCEEALAENPKNGDAWGWKGVILRNTGRPVDACLCYEKALDINPDDADTWLNRGMSIRFMNRKDAHVLAIEAYQNAIRLDPSCTDAMMNLGNVTSRIALSAPDIKEADRLFALSHEAYGKALALRPDDAALHGNMAVLYHKEKKLDEALAEAKAAVSLDPGYQDGVFTLAAILADQADHKGAAEQYERALALDPRSVTAVKILINLGASLFELERPAEAVDAFDRAAALDPMGFMPFLPMLRANAMYNKALVLTRMGQADAAKDAYAASLAFSAQNTMFYEVRKEATSPAAAVHEHIRQ